MVEQHGGYSAWPPIGSPLLNVPRDDRWRHFDNSVNAVSFGFVATAILISMFLVMAIFERFLRPTSGRTHGDLESQMGFNAKLGHPSPKLLKWFSFGGNIASFFRSYFPVCSGLDPCFFVANIDDCFCSSDISPTA
uniref:Uncharacterized protein n=1 Tax=Manihot esculenta TaxID=3983 RepID=A0A2C9U7V5_MANES